MIKILNCRQSLPRFNEMSPIAEKSCPTIRFTRSQLTKASPHAVLHTQRARQGPLSGIPQVGFKGRKSILQRRHVHPSQREYIDMLVVVERASCLPQGLSFIFCRTERVPSRAAEDADCPYRNGTPVLSACLPRAVCKRLG